MKKKFGTYCSVAKEITQVECEGITIHYGYMIESDSIIVLQSYLNSDGDYTTNEMYLKDTDEAAALMATIAAALRDAN